MLAIIGGTGLTQLENLSVKSRKIVRTPYGEPSSPIVLGELGGKTVAFLARHGGGHTIPPHMVNYRANIWALKSVGVCDILAVATVCGIHVDLGPSVIALPNQLIDYTHGRLHTFHDGLSADASLAAVRHIDFTHPYNERLRMLCLSAAKANHVKIVDGGIYGCVQGPRLETAAEINRMEQDGATMVGMTGMPEAALACELDMAYTAICPVANHAAGRGTSSDGIAFEQIGIVLAETMHHVRKLLEGVVTQYGN